MLTGQVFTVMADVATDEQVVAIAKSADKYLYDEAIGGYRLNTDFKEVKTDLGRLFGFAFGHKENGAVFSHFSTFDVHKFFVSWLKQFGVSSACRAVHFQTTAMAT